MTQSVKLAVLFFSLVIDVFGIGIMLPVMPGLVRDLNGGDISSAAVIYGWLIALYSLMQFVFGPAVGALSDRFGRRPILLCSMLGLGLDYLLLAVAPNFGIIGVAFGVGFVVGPVVGGFLGEYGPRVPFYAAAGVSLVAFIFALF